MIRDASLFRKKEIRRVWKKERFHVIFYGAAQLLRISLREDTIKGEKGFP